MAAGTLDRRVRRTYLVECLCGTPGASWGPDGSIDGVVLATLDVPHDDQLLVLVLGGDEAAAARRCEAAGLTVDRVVEVTLRPAWRWRASLPRARRRGRGTRR